MAAVRRRIEPGVWKYVLAGAAFEPAYILCRAPPTRALRLAPAAPVAAVPETSVLLATVLAALLLKERVSALPAAGAVVGETVLLVV